MRWFYFLLAFLIFFKFLKGSDDFFGWSKPALNPGTAVRADAAGYYSYLPKWFIYRSDSFDFLQSIGKKYPNERFREGAKFLEDGNTENKFFPGVAIASSPFFLAGH